MAQELSKHGNETRTKAGYKVVAGLNEFQMSIDLSASVYIKKGLHALLTISVKRVAKRERSILCLCWIFSFETRYTSPEGSCTCEFRKRSFGVVLHDVTTSERTSTPVLSDDNGKKLNVQRGRTIFPLSVWRRVADPVTSGNELICYGMGVGSRASSIIALLACNDIFMPIYARILYLYVSLFCVITLNWRNSG